MPTKYRPKLQFDVRTVRSGEFNQPRAYLTAPMMDMSGAFVTEKGVLYALTGPHAAAEAKALKRALDAAVTRWQQEISRPKRRLTA